MNLKLLRILRDVVFRLPICRTLKIRFRYGYNLFRIRKECAGRRIRVAFLVNEIAKWKAQSLYDLMNASNHYEPFIVLTFAERDWGLTDD